MPRPAKVLIVDDEKLIRWSLRESLTALGWEVLEADDGRAAIELAERETPDVMLLDVRLPGADGMTVLKEILGRGLQPAVVMMSAHGTLELAVEAMKNGATDFLRKPFQTEEVEMLLARLTGKLDLEREAAHYREREEKRYGISSLVGTSPAMREVRELVAKIADSAASNILVEGESGTGKGLVAKVIHHSGTRGRKPFIEVSCTALQETLVESELFGHEKGSFTDAKAAKKGLFELAEGGTIFLDEIGDLPLPSQAKLLRVLEERTFKRVGGVRDIRVDARVVAATNRDLSKESLDGRFRRDLYFRLAVLRVHMQPVRERPEDVPQLVGAFIDHFNREFRRRYEGVEPAAMDALCAYPWPGNVRELRNAVERVMILEDKRQILVSDLPADIRCPDLTPPGDCEPAVRAAVGSLSIEEMERRMIEQALDRSHGNQTKAAQILGVSRDTLRYRMKKFGLGNGAG